MCGDVEVGVMCGCGCGVGVVCGCGGCLSVCGV